MLLIDLGNSAAKFRYLHDGEQKDNNFSLLSHHYHDLIHAYLSRLELTSVYLSSVANERISDEVLELLKEYFPASEIHSLHSLAQLDGLNNGYDDFRQLGVDRWLAAVAAWALYDVDAIIVDAGSAITLDLLSRGKGFLGGAILPGLHGDEQRFRQLFPDVDFNDIATGTLFRPGTNTHDCLLMPDTAGSVAAAARLLMDWRDLLDNPRVILSGQDAATIKQQLDHPCAIDIIPDLVFQGMLKQIELSG
jgi:type III pantothenate kinase